MYDRNGKPITINSTVFYEPEQVILEVVEIDLYFKGFPTFIGDDGGTLYRWVDPRECELIPEE